MTPGNRKPAEPPDTSRSDARRISRRGFALGLAATAGTIAIGRSAFGHQAGSDYDDASPVSSPAASPAATPTAGEKVTIASFSFTPPILKISSGTDVTWTNTDSVAHTVISDDKTTFASDPLQQNDHVTVHFAHPGTFAYHCSIHPSMKAQIIVS